jgi:hypothetical protein
MSVLDFSDGEEWFALHGLADKRPDCKRRSRLP